MEKPFDEFGGWLRFFWIINLLTFILIIIAIIINFLVYAFRDDSFLCAGFIVLQMEFILRAFIAFKTLKYLKERNPANPNKIVLLLFATILISLPGLFFKGNMPFQIVGSVPESAYASASNSLSKGMFLLVWLGYFQVSKRVKTFYGANSMPPKIKWFNKKIAAPADTQPNDHNV